MSFQQRFTAQLRAHLEVDGRRTMEACSWSYRYQSVYLCVVVHARFVCFYCASVSM